MIDIHATMAQLAKSRPLFHSEADFQLALAWKLQEGHPQLSIRLEYRPAQLTQRGYIDVWATDGHEVVAIELKYKTRSLQATANGEVFDLLDQSAQDIGRYDTLKDIQRLEQVVAAVPNSAGFLLLLTNDRSYWTASSRQDTVDAHFRLHEGRLLTGQLSWGDTASAGTRRSRESHLLLAGSYELKWRDYSIIKGGSYGTFRYVLVSVARREA
jgi:hypothetical protein